MSGKSKHFVTQQINRIQDGLTQTHSQQLRLYHLNLTQHMPIISNTTCDQSTAFFNYAQQQQNEPDISTSVFFSDKGYFEMNNIVGDTIVPTLPIVGSSDKF